MLAKYRHVLIVGGTGMLLGASAALGRSTSLLTSVARTDASQRRLADKIPHSVTFCPLRLDWKQRSQFLDTIDRNLCLLPPPDLALLWLHGTELIFDIRNLLARYSSQTKIFQVIGSASSDPIQIADKIAATFERDNHYHQIVLGYQLDRGSARWLSHTEICEGTLSAVREGRPRFVIGRTKNWPTR